MSSWFKIALISLLCFPANIIVSAGVVTIHGTNSDYAGKKLEFFIYSERIFDSHENLAKTVADSSGNFSVSFSLSETQCVYCQTPLYTAYIFAEPGKSYHVELPPLPTDEDENTGNPFFNPPLWHMVPSAGNEDPGEELNDAVSRFDRQFEPFLDKQILRYYDPGFSREKLDSFINANTSIPAIKDPEYFVNYRLYKFAILGFMVSQFSHNDLYETYLKGKPARPDIPSWWEFFNIYFDGYFSTLYTKPEFTGIYSLVGNASYDSLFQLLGKDPALEDTRIREWIILKELHNEFYANGLPLNTLSALCDSLSARTTSPLNIKIAEQIKKQASSLLIGNSPPPALVRNYDGDSLDLSSLVGKYSYIGFCSLDNLGCQQEFEYLKYFYHKHSAYLDIIIILPDSEVDRIPSFSDHNSIPWKFYYENDNKQILEDYNVKAFPVFYLLDREGKLIMSPAILPSDGFEQHLFNILKARKDI